MRHEFHNLSLYLIDRCLRWAGSGVVDYRLPSLADPTPRDMPHEIFEELAEHNHNELRRMQDESPGHFHNEQRAAFDSIMAAHAPLFDEDDGRRKRFPAYQRMRQGGVFSSSPGQEVLARPSFTAQSLPQFAPEVESLLSFPPAVSPSPYFNALAPPTPSSIFPYTSRPTTPASWTSRARGPAAAYFLCLTL